jgi:hypothetical protein
MTMKKTKMFTNPAEKDIGTLQRSLMPDKELINILTQERDDARERRNTLIKEIVDIKARLRDLIHGNS